MPELGSEMVGTPPMMRRPSPGVVRAIALVKSALNCGCAARSTGICSTHGRAPLSSAKLRPVSANSPP